VNALTALANGLAGVTAFTLANGIVYITKISGSFLASSRLGDGGASLDCDAINRLERIVSRYERLQRFQQVGSGGDEVSVGSVGANRSAV